MCRQLAIILIVSSFYLALANDKVVPEATAVRRDLCGDPLPDGAVARLGTLRWRTGKSGYYTRIELLAFAPNDNTIACVGARDLWFFDKANGKLTKRLPFANAQSSFERFAFSPDGTRLACGGLVPDSDTKWLVQIWDLLAGRKVQEFEAERLQWLGWSANGQPLAVVMGKGMVFLRELTTGTERRFTFDNLPAWLSSCAYAAAKKMLAVPDEHCIIHVWDAATGEKRCDLQTNGTRDDSTRSLAFSPDGHFLASVTGNPALKNNVVQLWDVASGKVKHTVAAEQEKVIAVAFAPDGKILATVGVSDVCLWDVSTGRECNRMTWGLPQEQKRFRMSGGPSFGQPVVFSSDGKTLVTWETYSGAIHLWDIATGALKPEPPGHTKEPWHVAFSPDGRRVATGGSFRDCAIYIWDPATGEALTRIRRQEWVRGCAFSSDGRILYTCWTGNKLYFLDAGTGRELHSVNLDDPERPEPEQMGWDMWLSADGKTLLADSVNEKKLNEPRLLTAWEPATRKPLFRRQLDRFVCGAISADGKVMAAVSEGIALAKGQKQVPGSDWGPIRLEEVATGKQLLTFPTLEGQTQPLGFSPDGRLLITATSGAGENAYTLRLWEVATAAELHALPMRTGFHLLTFSCVAFSPDGRVLALSSASQEILLWDVWRSKELRRIKGFGAEVTSLAFSPDGNRLVSGLTDSTLLVWDVATIQKARKPKTLEAQDAKQVWADLGADAPKAFAARAVLVESPENAVSLFKERLKPAQRADSRQVRRLIANLDSDGFATRDEAQNELEEIGEAALDALRQALANRLSPDARSRIETLILILRGPVTRQEVLRALRAVAVLEDIATPEARELLQKLAKGAPGSRLTVEAKASLERLAKRVSRSSTD
jgi:WD40 repeat protein